MNEPELNDHLDQLAGQMAADRQTPAEAHIEHKAAQAALLLARGLVPDEAHATGDEAQDAENELIMHKARTRNLHNQLRGLH